jgi:photosystem II stability/assembly factor-like uncharacterized protein
MYHQKISQIFTQISLLGFIVLPTIVSGQEWVEWQFYEPADIAIHPDSSHIIYMGTGSNYSRDRRGGLMVSYDYGDTFDTLFSHLSILEIEFHPNSPDTLFLAAAQINYTRPGVVKVVRYATEYDTTWMDAGIQLYPDRSVSCIEIDPLSPDTMFVGTVGFGGGDLWRSIDGGFTWSDATPSWTGDVPLVKQSSTHPSEVFYSPGDNSLYRSIDWGETWDATTEWGGEGEILTSIVLFQDFPNRILISAYGAGAYLSENSGASWTSWSDHIPSQEYGKIITHPTNSALLYLATTDSVFFSDDFGDSWLDYTYNRDQLGSGVEMLILDTQNNRLFTGAHWSGLFSLDLNTVAINQENHKGYLPRNYEITSVYPNPFNPSATIEYEISEQSDVSLIVYDVSGREVQDLVSNKRSPGAYTVRWNGTDQNGHQVPAGMYFARLQAGEYSSVVKMVYLR